MIIALLAATILMADTATTLQAQPPTVAASEVKPKKADAPAFACRRDATLGARLPTRRCRSSAEVVEPQRAEREKLPTTTAENTR